LIDAFAVVVAVVVVAVVCFLLLLLPFARRLHAEAELRRLNNLHDE
jgi:hypothetical protein